MIRLVAIHNRALTLAQIQQNFEAGVGEKFFLLFGVEHLVNVPQAYVMFEARSTTATATCSTSRSSSASTRRRRRAASRSAACASASTAPRPRVGQAYRLLDTRDHDANYEPETGQTLSTIGTVIPLEKGPTRTSSS